MKRTPVHSLICWILVAVALATAALPRPGFAITLGEEEELSRQIMRIIFKRFEIVQDPYIAAYVSRVGRRVLAAMPEQPFRYQFYVIKDDSYNAFATPGGHIFVHTGLLQEPRQLAGHLGGPRIAALQAAGEQEDRRRLVRQQLQPQVSGPVSGASPGSSSRKSGLLQVLDHVHGLNQFQLVVLKLVQKRRIDPGHDPGMRCADGADFPGDDMMRGADDTAGQLADRLHFLGLEQLILKSFPAFSGASEIIRGRKELGRRGPRLL